ncbi:hypothetical protein IO98_14905 [Lacrimispora celerecrescens]|uniref:Crystallin n=2 Tax=Lacrimispora celerecrescens TaxID=29354 RepID=A0A084JJZ2_9FIRM|nr:hypothetical protein IO98_14905 [Lacrimispora celerecrescens]
MAIPTIKEKCTGALVASAIGDALGWPYEFRARNKSNNIKNSDFFIEWTRSTGGKYWNHYENILPGEYSDDTQMILSVARSIIGGDWENIFAKNELPFWLEYERGGGFALKRAAKILKGGTNPWESNESQKYFNAGGNGAVMRILPHVIARACKIDIKELMIDVIKDSIFTHGHPRAILGATCYAYALSVLLRKESVLGYGELINSVIEGRGEWAAFPDSTIFSDWIEATKRNSDYDYFETWSLCAQSMVQKLNFISNSLKKGLLVNDKEVLEQVECFAKSNGAGDVAILSALYLTSRYANNPILGIKSGAFSVGADTDTIASITGGLLGMLCGITWIPAEWKMVQDYNCLINIAESLLAEDMKEATKKITTQYKEQYNNWESSPIGKIRAVSDLVVPSGKTGIVYIKKVESLSGQTFYLKKFERIKSSSELTQNIKRQPATVPLLNKSKVFSLNNNAVETIIKNPLFERITLKKVLQILYAIMNGNQNYAEIAKKNKVDQEIVEVIKDFVIKE